MSPDADEPAVADVSDQEGGEQRLIVSEAGSNGAGAAGATAALPAPVAPAPPEPVPSPDEAVVPGQTLRLTAPPSFRLLDLGAIADDVVVTAGGQRTMTSIYLDTADLRLVRWGAVVRHRAGEGWTVRLPVRGGQKPRELHFEGESALPPEAATELLVGLVRGARLRPVARLRTVRHVVVLRTHEGRLLAEIDDDEVSVLDGRRVAARFREVDVDVADGAPAPLLRGLLERLRAAGCGDVDPAPKLVHALGARALEPPEVAPPRTSRESSAGDAVRRAIASSVLRLLEHDPGLRIDLDPEDVHQARVATRRLRSDLRTFGRLLERGFGEPLREELSWLGGELGAVRDAEVLAMRLRARAQELPDTDIAAGLRVVAALDATVDAARLALARTIREERYVQLLDDLVAAAQDPPLTELADHTAASVCPDLVVAPWRRLRRSIAKLDRIPSDDALHLVRIDAKRCRYAAEAVAPVLGKRAAAFGRAAARLQEVLGDFHDAVVAAQWLRAHGRRGGNAFVVGQLYAHELVAAQHGRDHWREAWRHLRGEWSAWT